MKETAITTQILPQPNSADWHNTDVIVSFTATDNLSGIASVTQPVTVSTEGKDQHIGGEALDLAGNSAATYVIINLDKTPLQITLNLNPIKLSDDEDDEYNNDEDNWYELIYSAQDSLSGLKSLKAGLAILSIEGYKIELEQDDELEIRIDEKKKELEIEASNPEKILTQLQEGLLKLNSGQILQLKIKQGDPKWKLKEKENGIEIQTPSIVFKAIASDYADNQAIKELEFEKEIRKIK